jgi:hypothetical protein
VLKLYSYGEEGMVLAAKEDLETALRDGRVDGEARLSHRC